MVIRERLNGRQYSSVFITFHLLWVNYAMQKRTISKLHLYGWQSPLSQVINIIDNREQYLVRQLEVCSRTQISLYRLLLIAINFLLIMTVISHRSRLRCIESYYNLNTCHLFYARYPVFVRTVRMFYCLLIYIDSLIIVYIVVMLTIVW